MSQSSSILPLRDLTEPRLIHHLPFAHCTTLRYAVIENE